MRTISLEQKYMNVPASRAKAQHRSKNNFRSNDTSTRQTRVQAMSTDSYLFSAALQKATPRPKPSLTREQIKLILLRKRSAFVSAKRTY